MTSATTTRTSPISRTLVAVAMALVLSLLLAHAAGATRTNLSISARNKIQTQNCQDLGGSIEVNTVKGSRTNGGQPIKSTTTCTGGGLDGVTCTNVKGSTSCTSALVPTQQHPDIAAPGTINTASAQAIATTSPTTQSPGMITATDRKP